MGEGESVMFSFTWFTATGAPVFFSIADLPDGVCEVGRDGRGLVARLRTPDGRRIQIRDREALPRGKSRRLRAILRALGVTTQHVQ